MLGGGTTMPILQFSGGQGHKNSQSLGRGPHPPHLTVGLTGSFSDCTAFNLGGEKKKMHLRLQELAHIGPPGRQPWGGRVWVGARKQGYQVTNRVPAQQITNSAPKIDCHLASLASRWSS